MLSGEKMETENHEVLSWFADVFDHKVPQRHQRDKTEVCCVHRQQCTAIFTYVR